MIPPRDMSCNLSKPFFRGWLYYLRTHPCRVLNHGRHAPQGAKTRAPCHAGCKTPGAIGWELGWVGVGITVTVLAEKGHGDRCCYCQVACLPLFRLLDTPDGQIEFSEPDLIMKGAGRA